MLSHIRSAHRAAIARDALTVTGMTRESARFQARSALTGAGFTTSESEMVVNHPVDQRLSRLIMKLLRPYTNLEVQD